MSKIVGWGSLRATSTSSRNVTTNFSTSLYTTVCRHNFDVTLFFGAVSKSGVENVLNGSLFPVEDQPLLYHTVVKTPSLHKT
jgi:hypothetical protein